MINQNCTLPSGGGDVRAGVFGWGFTRCLTTDRDTIGRAVTGRTGIGWSAAVGLGRPLANFGSGAAPEVVSAGGGGGASGGCANCIHPPGTSRPGNGASLFAA